MASLSLEGIQKIYPNGFHAVKDFNLEIEDKEFIIFVGPSGCGKSTTLRMIAGLEDISGGTLKIDGKVMNDVEPKDRDIAMVFQNYALYPHMTVYDNMAFGLKLRKVPKDEIDKKVREAARILDLEKLLDRKPKALSGGQRQRVAMGRAIVRNPKVFLMDEPLSNLDAKLRGQMRVEISKLHQRLGTTIIYVTHDQTEAMTLGTRIVVMNAGVLTEFFFSKAEPFTEALEMDNFTGPQESDGVRYIRVVTQTKNVVIGYPGFLLCCQVFCKIGDHIAFYADAGGVPGGTRCSGGVDTGGVVSEIGSKTAFPDLILCQVPSQLVNDGAHHFKVSKFFCTDIGKKPLQFRIGHGVTLAQIAQRCSQFAVRAAILADDPGSQLGIGLGDLDRVLQTFLVYKHYFCPPLLLSQGQGSSSQV